MSLFFHKKKQPTPVAVVPAATSTAPVTTSTPIVAPIVESINLAPIENIATLKQQITDLTSKNEALTKQMSDMEQSYTIGISSFEQTAEGKAAMIIASTGCPPVVMVTDQTNIAGNKSSNNLPRDRTERIAALGNQLKSQQRKKR